MIRTDVAMSDTDKPVTIAFIVHMASNTRAQKRVAILESLGARAKVLAFERHTYSGKPWPQGYVSLGWIRHGFYHKRLPTFLTAFFKVRKAVKASEAAYVFGQDLLLLGLMACVAMDKKPVIICEIGDIEGILIGSTPLSRILRWLERRLFERIDLLVVTSESYLTDYYHKIQGIKHLRHMVIENKVDPRTHFRVTPSVTRKKWNGTLTIGYFGIYWYPRAWEVLKRIVAAGDGCFRLYLRGIAMNLPDFDDSVSASPHMHYGGPFVSPDELPDIYGEVDVVWLAFDVHNRAKKWVRSNRFYQACFFRKPMIAQAGTQDGVLVAKSDLGLCIDLDEIDVTIGRMRTIGESDLLRWQKNIARLPETTYCYGDEHQALIDFLREAT